MARLGKILRELIKIVPEISVIAGVVTLIAYAIDPSKGEAEYFKVFFYVFFLFAVTLTLMNGFLYLSLIFDKWKEERQRQR